jgi:AraC family transcriptional activator of pobA
VLIVSPPGVVHAFRFSSASEGHMLTLDASRLAEGDAQDAGSALQRLLLNQTVRCPAGWPARWSGGWRSWRRRPRRTRRSLYTRWVVLVEARYPEHWPVSRCAQQLGLSTESLNRMVRSETGMNAQAVLHARLVREAGRRLVHVAAPVSKLAFELGFEEPAYFCRVFKRHMGMSPSTYRAQALRASEGGES